MSSPEVLDPYQRFADYGIVTCQTLQEVNAVEAGIAFNLLPESRRPFFDRTPFLKTDQLATLLRPKGFNGSLKQIIVEAETDALASLQDFRPRIKRAENAVGLNIAAEAVSTKGPMGYVSSRVWYYLYPEGSYSDVLTFPVKRVAEKAAWLDGSRFEEVLSHLGAICAVGEGRKAHSFPRAIEL